LVTMCVKYNILSPLLLGFGGSLYVALETAIAFSRRGYSVCFNPIINYSGLTKELTRLSNIYGIPREELKEIRIGPCDSASLIMNLTGDVLSGVADVVYFHYPSILKPSIYYTGLDEVYSIVAHIYYIVNLMYKPAILRKTKVFLANSTFTKKLVEKVLGVKADLVHPPVNLTGLLDHEPLPRESRENVILAVTRFSQEKQPHRILFIAKILKDLNLDDWRVVCVGSSSKYAEKIVKTIKEVAWRKGLSRYITIYRDLPRSALIELYRKAFIYVHLTPREHFGISVVEALAAGTPAVIPRDNGAWFDIANQNPEIVQPYSNYQELARVLEMLIEDKALWNKLSANARKRAEYFKRERFHEEITKIIEEKVIHSKKWG